MNNVDAAQFIDTTRYPIDQIESTEYKELVAEIREQLDDVGCAVIPGFIRKRALQPFVEEADCVADKGHRSFNRTNAYFSTDDESLEPDHPVRRFYDRSNSFVPADNFGADSPLRAVYEWPAFMPFIQDTLNETEFYRYADPLADVIINVVEDGDGFPWHFDTNNYTVTLAIQNGEDGGEFKYSPNLRSSTDENYNGVKRILDGDEAEVNTLELNPGDLQIFKGRYSLHRVTPVEGNRKRHVGIFSFVDQPNMVAKVERCKQLYGRVLPIHYERENQRNDSLLD